MLNNSTFERPKQCRETRRVLTAYLLSPTFLDNVFAMNLALEWVGLIEPSACLHFLEWTPELVIEEERCFSQCNAFLALKVTPNVFHSLLHVIARRCLRESRAARTSYLVTCSNCYTNLLWLVLERNIHEGERTTWSHFSSLGCMIRMLEVKLSILGGQYQWYVQLQPQRTPCTNLP